MTIEYLGYIISPSGITLSSRHVDAVNKFPQSRKVVEVQRFLGLINYFRKFIKDYAVKARSLNNFLRKSTVFNFDESCQRAFQLLKKELIAYPVLRLYKPFSATKIHTDASAIAVAEILLQKQESNNWAPVAYSSQATNKAEAKYHSFELEMLAIVKTIERFHIYLYGLEITVVTDCHALVYALNKTSLNPRIARWILKLQNYHFSTVHRDGRRMAHVDALSRTVGYLEAMPLENELQYRQLQDIRLRKIAEDLEFTNNDKFVPIDGLVYKKFPDKPRFAVSEAIINNVIRDEVAHCGIEKTCQYIFPNWFPSLRRKV